MTENRLEAMDDDRTQAAIDEGVAAGLIQRRLRSDGKAREYSITEKGLRQQGVGGDRN